MCRGLNLDLIVKAVHFVAQNALEVRVTMSVALSCTGVAARIKLGAVFPHKRVHRAVVFELVEQSVYGGLVDPVIESIQQHFC